MSNQTPPFDHEHDLLDFADRLADGQEPSVSSDLESTVLRVQRSLRSDAADPDAMPAELKSSIWENIMQTSGTAQTAAPGNPWQGAAPQPKRRARGRATRPASRPLPPQRMRWSGAANIALTVLLIVAAFGAVRAFEGSLPFSFGGDGGPGESRLAAVPGTPDESLLPAVQGTPEASADAAFACDFSSSVPIYSGIDTPPDNGTALYMTSGGDLTLTCPEEPEPIMLSRDVSTVSATQAPGVVQIQVADGNSTGRVMMNVVTNEWIELNPDTFSSYLGNAHRGGTLQVFPVTDSPTEWSLLNLETMQSAPLSDITGAKYPASGHIMVASAADENGIAVSTSEYRSEGSGTLRPSPGADGDIAVIDGDLETVHWISVPSYFPEITNIALSPDASKVALISNLTSFSTPTETTAISVIDVATGEEVVRSEEFLAPVAGSFMQWVEDGEAIIYTTESAVHRLELEAGASATEVYASDGTLTMMPATTQPNLVHLKESLNEDESNLVILTTDSGETVTVAGDPWFAGITPVMPWTEELAPIVVHPNDDAGMTQVVHPVTGEPITESMNAPPPSTPEPGQPWMPSRLVTTAEEAPVSVVDPGNGELMAVELGGDEPDVTAVPAIPEDADGDLRLSADGTVLVAGQGTWDGEAGPWWSLDLTDPEADWVQGPEGSRVTWLVSTDQ